MFFFFCLQREKTNAIFKDRIACIHGHNSEEYIAHQ